jgi:hypothetical protein
VTVPGGIAEKSPPLGLRRTIMYLAGDTSPLQQQVDDKITCRLKMSSPGKHGNFRLHWVASTGGRMLRTALTALLLLVASSAGGYAQQFECPPGSTAVSGGGGIMCQCPDGSFAGLYSGCPMQQTQQPLCPSGTEYCGNSNQCCNAGFYCSRYGCTPHGAIECGGHFCYPGQQCSNSGGCIPAGSVDCGPYYCQSGQKCGNGWRACLAEAANDCGPRYKTSCEAGKICWVAPSDLGTLKKGQLYCPTFEQATDFQQQIRELAQQRERERLAEIARKKQEAEAKRQAEIEAKAKAAEERRLAAEADAKRKADEAARKAVEAEAKRKAEMEAKQRAEEAKRLAAETEAKRRADEITRKAAEAEAKQRAETEAKKNAEEAQRAAAAVEAKRKSDEAEAKRLALAAEAQRKADDAAAAKAREQEQAAAKLQAQQDAKIDRELLAIARDTKQSPANRAIAAIGLGKDPASYGIPNSVSSAPPPATNRAEREIAMIALGKTGPAIIKPTVSGATPASAEERMRAIMNDPKESDTSRKIAAIALGQAASNPGLNPAPVQPAVPKSAPAQPQTAVTTIVPAQPATASSTQTGPSAYTFAATVYGTVQVSQNGKIIATTTPQLAAQQFGYKVPNAEAVPSSGVQKTVLSSATSNVAGSPISPVAPSGPAVMQPKQSSNLWTALQTVAYPNQQANPKQLGSGLVAKQPTIPLTVSTLNADTTKILTAATKSTENAGLLLSHFYQSTPYGHALVDTFAAAGGEAAKLKFGSWATGLGYVSEGVSIIPLLQKKDYGGLASNLTSFAGSSAAASAGSYFVFAGASAGWLAAGTFTASYDLSSTYIAPKVAPYTGAFLYNLDPSFWTPFRNASPVIAFPTASWTPTGPPRPAQSNPFTQPFIQ